jgi:uncharacterized damage-inducible protein DinB
VARERFVVGIVESASSLLKEPRSGPVCSEREREMDLGDVRTGIAYNRWANRRLLDAARGLTEEELDRDLGGSFGSIRGALRHVLWGEIGWLSYWRNREFVSELTPEELPDLRSIVAEWDRHEEEKAAFVRGLTEADLARPWPVDADGYVLGELIQNVLVHSIHHRGQIVHMLRELGHTPPQTGFRHFLTETRGSSDSRGDRGVTSRLGSPRIPVR